MRGMLEAGKESINNPFKNDGDVNLGPHVLSAVALEAINQMCRAEFIADYVSTFPRFLWINRLRSCHSDRPVSLYTIAFNCCTNCWCPGSCCQYA